MLEASSLTVARGRRVVLRGVDVRLEGGCALHLTGTNGSGKTSLLRVLAGLAAPRSGHVTRAGACAFVPEKVVFAGALRAGEWLAAMRRLRGLEPLDWPAAAAASGLDPAVLGRSTATFSKGMLQRIALLEALEADVAAARRALRGARPRGPRVARPASRGANAGRRRRAPDRPHPHPRRCGAASCTSRTGPSSAARARGWRSSPPGRRERVEQLVTHSESDALLRELLADGWHIEAVR